MAKCSHLRSLPAFLAILLIPATSIAQVTSTIHGRISDPSAGC